MILELISDIYTQADKGEAVNTVLDDKTIYKMQDRIKEKGLSLIHICKIKVFKAINNTNKGALHEYCKHLITRKQ